jgi:adenosylmethionine-8-amino-7-oxononanoate aminotransferase
MNKSPSLVTRDSQVLWHPYSPLLGADPLVVERAEQEFLYLAGGRRITDLISSWWVNLHGHAHPHICQRLVEQFQKIDHVIFAGFTHQPAVELAERLLEHLPSNQERIFFSDNGSTAVEVAIKMAIQYWREKKQQRKLIAVLADSYHGDTVGAMSVSARGMFTDPFHDLLFEVVVLPRPEKDLSAFQDSLIKILESNRLAAFIYEPLVQGAAGMKFVDAEALAQGIKLCKEQGVICIADEVMTGFGRTGRWFASDYLKYKPDLMCLSKGITGGVMPLGATSCSAMIAEHFRTSDRSKTFFHGHSYTGNPLACAAGLASLDLLESQETWDSIERISTQHQQAALSLKGIDVISEVRTIGTILALNFKVHSAGYLSNIGPKLYNFFINRDLLIRPLGNIVYIMPPYCTTDESLERGYQALRFAASTEEIFDENS